MSCGRPIFVFTEFGYELETAERTPWRSRVLDTLNTTLERVRRQQLRVDLEKARQRGLLKDLNDRMFADMGIAREEADREARKPFWK